MDTIIISPHPDDEIIGCWEILIKKANPIIIYTDNILDEKRKKEILNLKKYIDLKAQLFLYQIPPNLLTKENIFYFPDPIYETHPGHRSQGHIGENLLRSGMNVIFYSVNMQAPYIHEVVDSSGKRHLLEKVYPSQKELWKNDHKYFLFEGYNKWIIHN